MGGGCLAARRRGAGLEARAPIVRVRDRGRDRVGDRGGDRARDRVSDRDP